MAPIKGRLRGNYNTNALKTPNEVFCSMCNKCFERRAILEHHIKTVHLNYRIRCPVCHERFISKSVWHRLMSSVHAIKSYADLNVSFAPPQELSLPRFQDSNSDDSPFLNMSFQEDKSFPSIANVLVLKKNETFGVHVVAKCDIDVGKVVIVSNAFATVECVESVDSCCFQCGKSRNNKFLKCPHCIDTFFCSKRCSKSKSHSSKCNKIFSSSDSYIMRLAFEIIKTAFEMANDTDSFIEFIKGVMFHKVKHRNCQPPYSTYGEILSLKGSIEKTHFTMAHKVIKCLLSLPKISCSNKPDLKRILYCMARRHIASIQLNSYSGEMLVEKGKVTRYSMHE